ncbi:hypothetical protein [Allocoleopsis franciscana]|uniref:Uncharacterized protein n=1 Tax=Allocoleopsis franciscana PCC 7113 TaxID=1173027 RepID=K9WL68_9CYAN|nr:hypothetical protein [Allocoleopsis franciscana]AFZ20524.1 hypothetical protein Mic7113_4856 [Allocoleopsis franciscana PCC 7113]
MLYSEYLSLNLTASKGCMNPGSLKEMSWNNIRLLITQNGVTKIQNLAGGIENIEEHLNNQLRRYQQQGWEAIKVERPQEKNQSRYPKNTIHCLLKRSISLEPRNRFKQSSKDSAPIERNFSIGA